jgi:uncharacterized membrane protein
MMALGAAWITTALTFLALDAIWLSQMAPRYYVPAIGEIMKPQVNVAAAGAFYVLYVTGVVFFAVAPALEKGGVMRALMLGAILGLVAYGAYDLTNLSTLRTWTLKLTVLDMGWGAVVTALAAAAGCAIAAKLA